MITEWRVKLKILYYLNPYKKLFIYFYKNNIYLSKGNLLLQNY